jgi:hypothetical protein
MTKEQISAVLESVRSWPEEDQEELVAVAREIEARRKGVYRVSDAERQGIEKGLEAMREGKFASYDRVAAILNEARSSRNYVMTDDERAAIEDARKRAVVPDDKADTFWKRRGIA